MPRKLTERQAAFCHHVAEGSSYTQAARDAGYSEHYANREAAKLVVKPQIAEYLHELRQEAKTNAVMSLTELQEWWSEAVRGEHPDAKYGDRLKASEHLAKSQGGFTEKVENTHSFNGVVGIDVHMPDGK